MVWNFTLQNIDNYKKENGKEKNMRVDYSLQNGSGSNPDYYSSIDSSFSTASKNRRRNGKKRQANGHT